LETLPILPYSSRVGQGAVTLGGRGGLGKGGRGGKENRKKRTALRLFFSVGNKTCGPSKVKGETRAEQRGWKEKKVGEVKERGAGVKGEGEPDPDQLKHEAERRKTNNE